MFLVIHTVSTGVLAQMFWIAFMLDSDSVFLELVAFTRFNSIDESVGIIFLAFSYRHGNSTKMGSHWTWWIQALQSAIMMRLQCAFS